MDIEIRHCNNIERARITLTADKLNIKFAPNGTGKSTLSRAITCAARDDTQGLQALMPFRLRGENPDNTGPSVIGADGIGGVMCFNEEYVGQFTFQQDELISDSFNILIRNEAHTEREREIEEMTQTIRSVFTDHTELNSLIDHLQELCNAFKSTSSGISRSSTGMRGLSGGNKIHHIPAGLENYQPYIRSERRVDWIDWLTKGLEFSPLSDGCCPFCTGDIKEKERQIRQVSEEYDKSIIKNLTAIIRLVEHLGNYLAEDARERLLAITQLQNGPEAEHIEYLVALKRQTDTLTEKLTVLRGLNVFSLQEQQNVREVLTARLIDLQFFPDLQCELTQGITDRLNTAIQDLINLAGPLQGRINRHRDSMVRLIAQHKTNINNFLTYAGYKYRVDIAGEGDQRKLRLLHMDFDGYVSGGSQHLSYGERNAFAIVLFMYECLSKNPGLIILDDPISSFDKNKKFAILEMLFRRARGECLKNRTVLMLTHDVEPVIDTLKSVRKLFINLVTASCLRLSAGVIEELPVNDGDIMTFMQICKSITASVDCEEIIKLIYLRRYFEIVDERGDAYQLLSNLFHRRVVPLDHREPAAAGTGYPEMVHEKIQQARRDIREYVDSFDYPRLQALISSPDEIKNLYRRCRNGYEKLQVFRLLELDQDHPVIRKFVNETYHIENEFICQLDPSRFDLIPEYVINHRDEAVSLSIALNISQYIAPRFRALPPSPKRLSDDEPNQLSIDRQVIDMHWTWIQGQKKAVGAEEFEHLFQREEFDWTLAEKFARLNWTTDVKIRALQINANLQWELAQYQSKKHRDSWRKLQQGDVRGGKLHSLGIAQVTERLEVSVTKRRNLAKHIPHWVNVWLASRISDKSYMSLAQIMRFMTGESHDEKRLKSSLKAVLQRLDSYEKKM